MAEDTDRLFRVRTCADRYALLASAAVRPAHRSRSRPILPRSSTCGVASRNPDNDASFLRC